MDFWHWGGFFKSVKGHVIKWWQQVVLPAFRLNNNENQNTPEKQAAAGNQGTAGSQAAAGNQVSAVGQAPTAKNADQESTKERTEGKETLYNAKDEAVSSREDTGAESKSDVDAGDILKRLEQEKQAEEEKRRREIEEMRRQRQEQERIDAIMNANKVDVNAFIAEGKANRENKPEENDKKQEEMRRVQEIMDRLNREAAEDEAKKRAEIEAARKEAEEKFR